MANESASKAGGLGRRSLLQAGGLALLAGATGMARPSIAASDTQKLTLVVGTSPPDPACHYLYYARENGHFRNNGLEVEIKGLVSATNATRAVIAGEADVGWPDGVSSIQARDTGAKLKVISAFSRKLDYVIIGSAAISSPKGLEGKRFASATIGGGTFVIPRALVKQAGGDATKVQFVALGNSAARAAALIAGTVDATIVTSSFVPRLLSYPNLRVIADVGAELPDFVYTWEIASESNVERKRGALEAFVVSLGEATRWASEHPSDAAELSVKLLPDANKDEIRAGILSYIKRQFWSLDGQLPPEVLAFTGERLLEAEQIKKMPVYADIVATSLMEAAKARLSRT